MDIINASLNLSNKIQKSNEPPKLKNKEIIPLHYDDRLPQGWHRKVSQRKNGASAGRYEVHIMNGGNIEKGVPERQNVF